MVSRNLAVQSVNYPSSFLSKLPFSPSSTNTRPPGRLSVVSAAARVFQPLAPAAREAGANRGGLSRNRPYADTSISKKYAYFSTNSPFGLLAGKCDGAHVVPQRCVQAGRAAPCPCTPCRALFLHEKKCASTGTQVLGCEREVSFIGCTVASPGLPA